MRFTNEKTMQSTRSAFPFIFDEWAALLVSVRETQESYLFESISSPEVSAMIAQKIPCAKIEHQASSANELGRTITKISKKEALKITR